MPHLSFRILCALIFLFSPEARVTLETLISFWFDLDFKLCEELEACLFESFFLYVFTLMLYDSTDNIAYPA